MPNHTSNVLEVSGNPKIIKALIKHVSTDEKEPLAISFQKIYPMPASLDIVAGSQTTCDLNAYKWTIGETEEMEKLYNARKKNGKLDSIDETLEEFARNEIKQHDVKMGEQVYNNIKNYGHPTWYEWRIDNWGTKWDAYDIGEWYEDEEEKQELSFCTAWGAPLNIIRLLSSKFPGLTLKLKYADEGQQFLGYVVYKNGQEIDSKEFDDDWESPEAKKCLEGTLYYEFEDEVED